MSPHVDELIPNSALGMLSDVLPLALPSMRPLDATRDRILEAVSGRLRFAPFTGRVARLFAIDAAEAYEALTRIADEDAWIQGPAPGFSLAPIQVGMGLAGASGAFIRARAGVQFPRHKHLGDETVLVMQGVFEDSDGVSAGAGDLVRKASGSTHDFTIPEGPDCVCAYLTLGGIEL
jgi:hypothetical protein